MLEQITLEALVKWLLIGGGIAILLERIPAWAEWQSPTKAAIVAALNVIGAFVLPAVIAQIPSNFLSQTLDKLILGAFMAAASFVIHQLDEWLKAAVAAKVNESLLYAESEPTTDAA